MRMDAYSCAVLASCLGAASVAQADLKPISDEEMSEVQGQAFMRIDDIAGAAHDFTRMSLNMEVETRVEIGSVQAGEYDGGIDFDSANVVADLDALHPYIELAHTESDELAGFRMGYQYARGRVSSDTDSFSGNIGLKIRDDEGNVGDATLFDAESVATDYRATHIGLEGETTDCSTGVQCAPISQLRSLDLGEDNGNATPGYTNDFFVGFQREDVDWQSPQGANVITAGKGVHINLPTSMTLDMSTLTGSGVPRTTERGTSIF